MTVAKREFDLWKKWKETGNDIYLQELMKSLEPLIKNEVSKYLGTRIAREAIMAEAYRLAYEALTRYDPSMGTNVGTWVVQWLRKLQRFVIQNQNISRIPERSVSKITAYKNALDELREILGRDPNPDEMAAHLGWPLSEVLNMKNLLIRDILVPEHEQEIEGETIRRVATFGSTREDMETLYAMLSPEEQTIFSGLTGFPSGRPKPLTQIAREMGISYREASSIKDRLKKKTEEFFFSRSAYGI